MCLVRPSWLPWPIATGQHSPTILPPSTLASLIIAFHQHPLLTGLQSMLLCTNALIPHTYIPQVIIIPLFCLPFFLLVDPYDFSIRALVRLFCFWSFSLYTNNIPIQTYPYHFHIHIPQPLHHQVLPSISALCLPNESH
jgi:hypothetical protein